MTINPGDYIFSPKWKSLVKVKEIISQKRHAQQGPWFQYEVIIGADRGTLSGLDEGGSFHNGWDYKDTLLADAIIYSGPKQLHTVSILYGKI